MTLRGRNYSREYGSHATEDFKTIIIGISYASFIVIVACYSAIIGKLVRKRCHPQVHPSSNLTAVAAANYQRREVRLALQFAAISVFFFCCVSVFTFQTPTVGFQMLRFVLLLIVVGIDTPVLCICNPNLRADIVQTVRCKSGTGTNGC